MSNSEMFVMWLGVFLGFICLVVAAGGHRMGWSKRAWVGLIVLGVVFLTVLPVVAALTMGLNHG